MTPELISTWSNSVRPIALHLSFGLAGECNGTWDAIDTAISSAGVFLFAKLPSGVLKIFILLPPEYHRQGYQRFASGLLIR